MEKIKKFFQENDLLAKYLGIELIEVGPGTAKTKMLIQDQHLNGVRMAHGGAIFTLADVAFAAACNSHGRIAVAVNVNISFLKAAKKGLLYAQAREVSKTHKLSNYTIDIKDEQDNLIAVFGGLAYRKNDSLDSFLEQA